MAKTWKNIPESLLSFIKDQPFFLVATAPDKGHINISPKGLDTFRILSPNKVAYLDLVGSGNETAAHILENGRITFLFMSFTRNPAIVRLYGTGKGIQKETSEFKNLVPHFPEKPGIRQIIKADIHQVTKSCGYGVPEMTFEKTRPTLEKWLESQGEENLLKYQEANNLVSMDGLSTGLNPKK